MSHVCVFHANEGKRKESAGKRARGVRYTRGGSSSSRALLALYTLLALSLRSPCALLALSLRSPCAFLALSSTCVSISRVAWLTFTGTTCFSQEILRNVYKFERFMSEFCAWKYQNQTKRTSYFSKISYASARLRSGLKAPGETSKADVQSFIQLVQSPILIIHEPRLHSKEHMAWRDTTFSADKNSQKQFNWSCFMIFQLMVVLKNDC